MDYPLFLHFLGFSSVRFEKDHLIVSLNAVADFFFFSSVGEEAERKGETKNKKTFHQLFDVRSESFFFAKLKNIFAD